MCGIVFVLYTGIPWEFLPQELGFGSGTTCWRRLRDWHQAGVWQQLHEALLAELHAAGALDWSKAVIDSSHVPALKGGPKRARARLTLPGRPRQRPDAVYADRGYDHDKYRKQVRKTGITPVIARRGTDHGSGLGVHRWVIEQSIALLHWFPAVADPQQRNGHTEPNGASG
jgi:transposase